MSARRCDGAPRESRIIVSMSSSAYKANLVRRLGLWVSACVLTVLIPARADVLERGLFRVEFQDVPHSVAEHTLSVLEEAVREFEPLLPPGNRGIRVRIVPVAEEFRRYAARFSGLNVIGLAKPGDDLIIVKAPRLRAPGSDYPGTLRHELVHLLVDRNLNSAHVPQWLNEGLAMMLANEHHWQSMFAMAGMFVRNRIIPYHRLDRAFYAPEGQREFGEAYSQALSMTRFLRNHLGEDRFWNVILAMDVLPFPQALLREGAISTREFWDQYQRSLWRVAIIAGLASGLSFQPAAVLLIWGYLRRRKIAQNLYRKWEEEEAEEQEAGIRHVRWEEITEDSEAWKQGLYDDDDNR